MQETAKHLPHLFIIFSLLICKCIHNWSLQPFFTYHLASHTNYAPLMHHLCELILCMSGGTYSLKSIPNDRFFEIIISDYLLSEFLLKICWKEIAEEIFFFSHISFWCLPWNTNPGFTSNKLTHYLLDHCVFLRYVQVFIYSWRNLSFRFGYLCWIPFYLINCKQLASLFD